VGTARLAIQLARVGVETWGIDRSQHMLKAAKANLDNEPQEVRNRIHLELADVRGFDLNEDFGIVYFPSYSFDHILERDDQIRALKAIRRHIALGGVYAFDLAHVPELRGVSNWFVQKKHLDGNRMVVRTGYNVMKPEERIMTRALGKTSVMKEYRTNKGILYLTDCTAYGIEQNYLHRIAQGEIKTLMIPDLLTPLAKQTKTRRTFVAFLNSLIEDGIAGIATGVMVWTKDTDASVNVITSVTSQALRDARHG
jgi:SAM-dependent methyltransferase